MQKLKELIKLSNLCNFQLFASSIEGNIRHHRNGCVAKKLMRRTSPVKFRVFRREFLRNHSMNWTQIFRENLNCYSLSIFRVFILLASSDSDKHMSMRQKVQTKICLYMRQLVFFFFFFFFFFVSHQYDPMIISFLFRNRIFRVNDAKTQPRLNTESLCLQA